MRGPGIPVVGIPCDIFDKGLHPFHGVGEKYINAVAHGARMMPVLIPGLGAGRDLEPLSSLLAPEELLASLDGIFLTGRSRKRGARRVRPAIETTRPRCDAA